MLGADYKQWNVMTRGDCDIVINEVLGIPQYACNIGIWKQSEKGEL